MNYKPSKFDLPDDGVHQKVKGKDHPPYVFTDKIAVAVDVALATDRPLLISGPPGSGKSSLAIVMADILNWRYLHSVFTSRTRLEDLTGDLDQLRRLNDAQVKDDTPLPERWAYLEPGVLWWAFDQQSANLRGQNKAAINKLKQQLGNQYIDPSNPSQLNENHNVVILLDEIDKADPDLPNDLLEPLDKKRFSVPQGPEVKARKGQKILVIITTNEERELPPAFLRRCINLRLTEPDETQLVEISDYHYPKVSKTLRKNIAIKIREQSVEAKRLDLRAPSTSEYLDTIEACKTLKVKTNSPQWEFLAKAAFIKEEIDFDN